MLIFSDLTVSAVAVFARKGYTLVETLSLYILFEI